LVCFNFLIYYFIDFFYQIGGNPYGPAGTGKTESVKALASCFGRQVLVFNCDEALERF
jgi:dynein heavy chain 2